MTETAPSVRSRSIRIRVTDGERKVLTDAARGAGCTVSALVREAVAERWLSNRLQEGTNRGEH